MKFLTHSASGPDTAQAVAELRRQFGDFPAAAMIFFASHSYDSGQVARLLREAFPGVVAIGCSSNAELTETGIRHDTIAAMAFSVDALEVFATAVVENMSTDSLAVEKAVATLESKLGCGLLDVDFSRHFGITLFDGRAPNIEQVLERVGNLSDIVFVGGYASDDFSMRKIHVYCDGKCYSDATILAVVKPKGRFALLKTQSAESTGISCVATKVDMEHKIVHEFNGRPAAEVFAEGIGIPLSELKEEHFLDYSLGLMAEGDPFIRAGRKILDSGGLQFFCTIREGQRLFLMRTGDIVSKTAKALEAKRAELGHIEAIVDFDCAHRDLSLQAQQAIGQYATLFSDVKTIGFATFGEAYIANVNQTAVMALFG